MVYTLHSAPWSEAGCLVIIVAKELGLYGTEKFKTVGTSFSELYSEEWAKHQPLQRMPYLEDTEAGIELYESRTICKCTSPSHPARSPASRWLFLTYLAAKVKSPLLPPMDGSIAWFKFDQMCTLENSHFTPPLFLLLIELIHAEAGYGRPKNMELVDAMNKELNTRVLPGYERILLKQKYIYGDELTLVDLFHVMLAGPVNEAGGAQALTDGSLPNVKRWFTSLTSRQSVKEAFDLKAKAHPIYVAFIEDMRKALGG